MHMTDACSIRKPVCTSLACAAPVLAHMARPSHCGSTYSCRSAPAVAKVQLQLCSHSQAILHHSVH